MARITRTRSPWPRGRLDAGAGDASFFEDDAKRWPRPDSPEVSVFTPEEEAESHRRWNQAMLRERFRGPMSGAERLGLGISAASLAALADIDRLTADAEAEAESPQDGRAAAADTGGGENPAARKTMASGEALKAFVTSKPAGPVSAFLETEANDLFSSPLANRADNANGARRPAPRGSGTPLESRGGTERGAEVTVLRKPEQAPTDARAPLGTEGSPIPRGQAAEANIAAVALVMRPEAPETERAENQDQTFAKAAAKTEQGRATVEAPLKAAAVTREAAPGADARVDQRPVPVETPGRDMGTEAAAILDAKVTGQGRSAPAPAAVAEAPGRSLAKDAAATEKAEVKQVREIVEAPVEAKAKDTAPVVDTGSGTGTGGKPVKAFGETKARDAEAVDSRAEPSRSSAVEAPGPVKAKDVSPVVEIKTDHGRVHAEALEQATTKGGLLVIGGMVVQDQEIVRPVSLDRIKATDSLAEPGTIVSSPKAEVASQAAKPTPPAGPVADVQPVKPTPPAGPVVDVQPVKPAPVAEPVVGVQPVKPAPVAGPVADTLPVKPTPAAEPVVDVQSVKPTPAGPVVDVQPVKPTPVAGPVADTLPVKPTPAAEPVVDVQPVKPTPAAGPVVDVQPVKPTPAAGPVVDVQSVKPTPAAEPVVDVQPVKPTPAAEPVADVQPVKPTPAAEPVVDVQPVKPAPAAEPVVDVQPVKPAPAAEPVVDVQPVKPTPAGPVVDVQPVKPAPAAEPVADVQPVKPTPAAGPVVDVQPGPETNLVFPDLWPKDAPPSPGSASLPTIPTVLILDSGQPTVTDPIGPASPTRPSTVTPELILTPKNQSSWDEMLAPFAPSPPVKPTLPFLGPPNGPDKDVGGPGLGPLPVPENPAPLVSPDTVLL